MPPSQETFFAQRHRRFGKSNPELMRFEYWEWMVREGISAYQARVRLGLEHESFNGPDWCFDRMGMACVQLPDGRSTSIGGEHEDFYDPDFCIYNDVVVRDPHDDIQIFGYSEELFPPTDFHSATLVRDRIIIIGRLGYAGSRVLATTPVFQLSCDDFRIQPLKTSGEQPGWIFKHEAELAPGGDSILVRGGELITAEDNHTPPAKNVDHFRLHLNAGRWERMTNRRHWRQFFLQPANESSASFGYRENTVFLPKRLPHKTLNSADDRTIRLSVSGVEIHCVDNILDARIIIEGCLDERTMSLFIEDIIENFNALSRGEWEVTELHAAVTPRSK